MEAICDLMEWKGLNLLKKMREPAKLSAECILNRYMTTHYLLSGHICPLSSHCVDTYLCSNHDLLCFMATQF